MSIGVPRSDNKGFVYRLGYGYLHELKQYHDDPLAIIKAIIANFPLSWTKEQARTKLDEIFKEKKETKKEVLERFKGYEVVEKLFDYFNIFNDCSPTKSTTLKDVVLQLIYQRIKNPISVFNTYKTAKKEKIDTHSKNSFYRSLDYIAKNKDEILRNLNAKICANTNRKIDVLWFDATTTYFETFSREGYKKPGYSKDGKFKEDQIVIGMATDENGIPLHYKIFPGNVADPNTLIPFMLEIADIYEVNSVTIIADKGMSVNRNIRFLESKNWKYIISYRMKAGSKQFKEYILDEKDYINDGGLIYKTRDIASSYNKKRINGHFRRQIISFSQKRATKDKNDRDILIQNFTKKMNKDNLVSCDDLAGSKKYRFFKPINKGAFYELDIEKIQEDQKYDGYYVYETNRTDLSVKEVINLYSKQWQIESNFKTLKGKLSLRPMYLSTWNHIVGYICLCFISLVFLNYIIYILNSKLGLTGKSKITEHKVINVIKEVKEIEAFVNKQKIETIQVYNDELQESWQTYQILLELLTKEKVT
ncbi:IS1634-like element IS1634 family transposase [Mycoplasma mycoides]|uniref:IS1634-like element IS1634 family transposase n=1 Tax=Mycoplasma mycoides TaxID=2102 RepID=UPI001BFF5BC4|nr:IS1634-like element IS1634 family transposase [Mycoplasma mycoides]